MKLKASLRFLLGSQIIVVLAAPCLPAADVWWDGGSANWSGGSSLLTGWSTASNATTPNPTAAPGASDNLFFNITTNNTANNVISHANAGRAALSMTFSTSGTTNFRAGGSSTAASTLTMGSGGITVNSGAGAVTIGQTPGSYGNITVALGANQTWTNNSAADLTVVGRITGSGRNLTKNGTGKLVLQGDNTFSGTTTIDGGAIVAQNASAFGSTAAGTVVNGTGTANTANARIELAGGITVTGESLTISGVGNFNGALTSTSGNNVWTGNVTIGTAGTRIGASANSSLEISGTIDSGVDAHGIVIRTADTTGSVILSGANSYLGTTQVFVGKLQLAVGDNRLPVGTSLVLSSGGSNPDAEFDLNGRNQEVAGLSIGGSADATQNSVNNSSLTGSTLTVNTAAASPSTYAGRLDGNLALAKTGADTLTLTGTNNTYTGATNVNQGTLIVNGNISTSVLTTVASTATISGSGSVGDLTIQSGGTVAPGNSPGILNVGDYIQAGIYNAEIEGLIAGNSPGNHDQINVTGAVDITGGSLTTAFNTFTPVNGDLIFILLNDLADPITGTYTGLAQGALVTNYGGFNWKISYEADSVGGTFTGGNDIALMAVPEPRAAFLGAIGVLLLLRRRRA